jgi:hypothetical protein
MNQVYKILTFVIIPLANFRVGLDRGIGKRTCKNRSVIDYFISSSSLFPFIQEFDINYFNPNLSDKI